jgi:hypothetical protein
MREAPRSELVTSKASSQASFLSTPREEVRARPMAIGARIEPNSREIAAAALSRVAIQSAR